MIDKSKNSSDWFTKKSLPSNYNKIKNDPLAFDTRLPFFYPGTHELFLYAEISHSSVTKPIMSHSD
jgi:hypothetical protein